jgi:uncharacterized phage protein gp47/JayE
MPWSTPTLKQTRQLVRDNVTSLVKGAAMIGNNSLRVMADAMAGMARLVLEYIDWLSKQLLPDTAEMEWLDRHGQIWLVNSDGTKGRKLAAQANGIVLATGVQGALIPAFTLIITTAAEYETTMDVYLDSVATGVPLQAVVGGSDGNLDPGTIMQFETAPSNVDPTVTVETMDGGTDDETDDELRARVLLRIQNPPMGGDANDYVQWALSYPGVTRAWCGPNEMGIGTVTVRIMMDQLRAENAGFPLPDDLNDVLAFMETVRPVAIKDFFVEAPIPYPINITINDLSASIDIVAAKAAILVSLQNAFFTRQEPAETWYVPWMHEAIMASNGVLSYSTLISNPPNTTLGIVMPYPGYMAVLGTVSYG